MPSLSKSLTQPLRPEMLMVGSGWRVFFAPWDYSAANAGTGGPKILDLQHSGPFSTITPPTGFVDCGWINSLKTTSQSKIGVVRSGYRGAIRKQYRGEVGETVDFNFREFGRLQYKIATGTQVFNLLSTASATTDGPLNGSGTSAVSLGSSGYVASGAVSGYVGKATVYVNSGTGSSFPAGTYIVVDDDLPANPQGLVGSNGAFTFPNAVTDTDYVRKTSDYVARVIAVVENVGGTQDALILDQPFIGGGSPSSTVGPDSNAKVQKIVGFASREGGTFIQEWSGLFIADTVDGAQAAMYFPHLSISAFKGLAAWKLENPGTTDEEAYELQATFQALAYDDPLDGETVVGYEAFYPNERTQFMY